MRNAYIIIGIGALILGGAWWYYTSLNIDVAKNDIPLVGKQLPQIGGHEESPPEPVTQTQGASIGEENAVEFACADGKSMTAIFTRDIVGITLSDGRQLTLRQATSGSLAGQAGVRYLNNTETIEFRSQGDAAFLDENGKTTYADCKASD